VFLVVLAAVLSLLVPASPAAAQGTADVRVDGQTVTVTVSSIPGHQLRVELPDGTIAATGLVDGTGIGVMTLTLGAGTYELEVITFDPAGIPTTVGTFPVTVDGPPPGAPVVEVRPGTAGDNRTVFVLTGPAGVSFDVEVLRDGASEASMDGEVGADGRGIGTTVVASGAYSYRATLSNSSGRSPEVTGNFNVELGTPGTPTLALASPAGLSPALVDATGIPGTTVVVAAELDGERVTEETVLDRDGTGRVELELRTDGTWEVTGIATNADGESSETATLDGGLEVNRNGPTLELELISADDGVFAYRVITDEGANVRVESETDALNQEFVAEAAETEFRVDVPAGEHTISVTATDALGNTNFTTLGSSDGGGGGSNFAILGLIILGILVAFGVFGYLRRQEIIDWWNTRQYH
jgi:hypothetical protein